MFLEKYEVSPIRNFLLSKYSTQENISVVLNQLDVSCCPLQEKEQLRFNDHEHWIQKMQITYSMCDSHYILELQKSVARV